MAAAEEVTSFTWSSNLTLDLVKQKIKTRIIFEIVLPSKKELINLGL